MRACPRGFQSAFSHCAMESRFPRKRKQLRLLRNSVALVGVLAFLSRDSTRRFPRFPQPACEDAAEARRAQP